MFGLGIVHLTWMPQNPLNTVLIQTLKTQSICKHRWKEKCALMTLVKRTLIAYIRKQKNPLSTPTGGLLFVQNVLSYWSQNAEHCQSAHTTDKQLDIKENKSNATKQVNMRSVSRLLSKKCCKPQSNGTWTTVLKKIRMPTAAIVKEHLTRKTAFLDGFFVRIAEIVSLE